VIKARIAGQEEGDVSNVREMERATEARDQRVDFRSMVELHVDFVFRSLRRLGVEEAAVDDAVQQVWIVAARRAEEIRSETARAFLFAIAVRVAADARRSARRRRHVTDERTLENAVDPAPTPHETLEQRRALQLLDSVLDTMPDDLRAIFILYELEQSTAAEIAQALSIPPGTVASRLRRAREMFAKELQRRTGGAR
jgi:RNA polymerase sigma-70 factor (ECF subfamily)